MARSSTTFPRKWNARETTVIRVPERVADDLLRIARRLDESKSYALREDTNSLVLEVVPTKRVSYSSKKPVNVSSVPQRSPFRYPGGKTWLVPYIRDWLRSKKTRPSRLIEPFAGGGIVSLTSAFEGLARHVVFAELDSAVASVWRVVFRTRNSRSRGVISSWAGTFSLMVLGEIDTLPVIVGKQIDCGNSGDSTT